MVQWNPLIFIRLRLEHSLSPTIVNDEIWVFKIRDVIDVERIVDSITIW